MQTQHMDLAQAFIQAELDRIISFALTPPGEPAQAKQP